MRRVIVNFHPSLSKMLLPLLICGISIVLLAAPVIAQGQPGNPGPDNKKAGTGNDKVKVDLAVGGVSENLEDNAADGGVLIPLNDDFDEQNRAAAPSPGVLGAKRGDNETDAILGANRIVDTDNELKSASLTFTANASDKANKQAGKVENMKGRWTLSFSSSVKVWRQVGAAWVQVISGQASDEQPLSSNSTPINLKIEGISVSSGAQLMSDFVEAEFDLNDNLGGGSDKALLTVFKVNISSNVPEVEEAAGGSGAPVRINDDNDNQNVYPDDGNDTALGNPLEPIWDKDETTSVANEDDLLPLVVDVQPRLLKGALQVGYISRSNNSNVALTQDPIKFWKSPTKGIGEEFVSNTQIEVDALPQNGFTLYAEGVALGGSGIIGVRYKFRGESFQDIVIVRPVKLLFLQGNLKTIYDYNSDISFRVNGAGTLFKCKWDFDGDGVRAKTDKDYEDFTHINTTNEIIKYAPAASRRSVALPETVTNRRATYNVSVELIPSGLILSKTIKVALSQSVGNPLPPASNAGVQGQFAWTDTSPVPFDDVNEFQQQDYEESNGITQQINDKRIQYSALVPLQEENGVDAYTGAEAFSPTFTNFNTGERDRKNYGAVVYHTAWADGWHLQELTSIVNHEKNHLVIGDRVKIKLQNGDNVNNGDPWRELFASALSIDDYLRFEEADCYIRTNVSDNDVEWRFTKGMIQQFQSNYQRAQLILDLVPNTSVTDKQGNVTTKRKMARSLLQQMYQLIPFEEMKRSEYPDAVRAPK